MNSFRAFYNRDKIFFSYFFMPKEVNKNFVFFFFNLRYFVIYQ